MYNREMVKEKKESKSIKHFGAA